MDEYDEGEHVKEVFAYFGRAFYDAGVLETGLAMALMQVNFLTSVREKFMAGDRKVFDVAAYEADFDRFMENQHAQTMGNLLRLISASSAISDDLKLKLAEAKKRRDFLGHHYFRERAVDFVSKAGRDKMIAELLEDGDFFEAVDRQLQTEVAPVRAKLGLSSEKYHAYMKQFMAEHGTEYEDENIANRRS